MVFDPELFQLQDEKSRDPRKFRPKGQWYLVGGAFSSIAGGLMFLSYPPPSILFAVVLLFGFPISILILFSRKIIISADGIEYGFLLKKTILWKDMPEMESQTLTRLGWPSYYYDYSYKVQTLRIRDGRNSVEIDDNLFDDFTVILAVISKYSGLKIKKT